MCLEKDKRRATMMRFEADGSGGKIYASGMRNTEGFTWQPKTGALFGVNNGRDLLGDDFPLEEMYRIEDKDFYGWPFRNNGQPDPDFGHVKDPRLARLKLAVHTFGAHKAPISIIFLTSPKTPSGYQDAALVTMHGSWNRTKKSGYEVVSLHWQPDGKIVEKPFATGFQVNEAVFGRPVDIIQAPDGTLYLSDDFAKAVYRITYQPIDEEAN